jgi:surface antigen
MASASGDVSGSVGSAYLDHASSLPSDTDLVFTKLAIVEVLQRGGEDASAPWENPATGARGTVTPIATAYERDGATCRDFLASYIRRHGPETWMQGEACRNGKRPWEVKSLRPWARS